MAAALAQPAAPAPLSAAPKSVLVLPVDNLRKPGERDWLADWLQDALTSSLLRTGALAVGSRDTAGQWRAQFGTGPLANLPTEAWDRTGADAIVQAAVQPVLGLVDVRLRIQGRTGDRLPAEASAARIDLAGDPPPAALEKILAIVRRGLALEGKAATAATPQPADWKTVEAVYTALAKPLNRDDPRARPEQVRVLQPLADNRALRGRVYEAVAQLTLEQALLNERDAEQQRGLTAALRWIDAALLADPGDTDRHALKGEIHYFLKQDYQAKTEASIARLKNPANGLAYVVLALVAGPSTGEGTEQLKRAQRVDPFLWVTARSSGQPPFQAGVLEPVLQKWAQRQAGTASRRAAIAQQMSPSLKEGIDLYKARRWEEAQAKFRKAADEDEYDYRPLLYQSRILVETGHATDAIASLRELVAENPAEPDIQLTLGVALAKSGALEEARPQLEAALQDSPRQPQALFYLAQADLADRRWGPASESLATVVAQEPRNETAWFNLGIAQANLEQWKAADESFAHVLALNPKSQSAQEWRARIRPRLNP